GWRVPGAGRWGESFLPAVTRTRPTCRASSTSSRGSRPPATVAPRPRVDITLLWSVRPQVNFVQDAPSRSRHDRRSMLEERPHEPIEPEGSSADIDRRARRQGEQRLVPAPARPDLIVRSGPPPPPDVRPAHGR